MHSIQLYPFRFEPIYQYRLWGGRRLAKFCSAPLPGDDPIGEAWLLSDREDQQSLVADGPLRGMSIAQLLKVSPEDLLGKLAGKFVRFPLLLKFLDVKKALSVQVHPPDTATELLPVGETGKTEAWVVLKVGSESHIYAGLTADTTRETLQQAILNRTVADCLAGFTPKPGESILIQAGTVHSLKDIVVFEVQENSDVTFRLDDWNHVDPKTGNPRPLQIDQAMACINFSRGEIELFPVLVEMKEPQLRERVILCDHFGVWRVSGTTPFTVGKTAMPRVIVCLSGQGYLEYSGTHYDFRQGDVLLLPAVVGVCWCQPDGAVCLLEISLPEFYNR